MVIARPHQRADRGGRGVEDVDLVLVAYLPEAAGVRIGRHAFEHQRGRAIGQRSVDDIAVSGDPAHIGGAPVHIALVIIEHVLMRHRGPDEIAAGCVQHALGLAGGAGRVKDEQRVFRVHFLPAGKSASRVHRLPDTRRRGRHQSILPPVRLTTSTFFTVHVFCGISTALSVLAFSGIGLRRRAGLHRR